MSVPTGSGRAIVSRVGIIKTAGVSGHETKQRQRHDGLMMIVHDYLTRSKARQALSYAHSLTVSG
jgi:hypothetical protein